MKTNDLAVRVAHFWELEDPQGFRDGYDGTDDCVFCTIRALEQGGAADMAHYIREQMDEGLYDDDADLLREARELVDILEGVTV